MNNKNLAIVIVLSSSFIFVTGIVLVQFNVFSEPEQEYYFQGILMDEVDFNILQEKNFECVDKNGIFEVVDQGNDYDPDTRFYYGCELPNEESDDSIPKHQTEIDWVTDSDTLGTFNSRCIDSGVGILEYVNATYSTCYIYGSELGFHFTYDVNWKLINDIPISEIKLCVSGVPNCNEKPEIKWEVSFPSEPSKYTLSKWSKLVEYGCDSNGKVTKIYRVEGVDKEGINIENLTCEPWGNEK